MRIMLRLKNVDPSQNKSEVVALTSRHAYKFLFLSFATLLFCLRLRLRQPFEIDGAMLRNNTLKNCLKIIGCWHRPGYT